MVLMAARIISVFSSYGKPKVIASAMATGITLAFIPGGTLLWFLIFIPMMLIRINQAALIGMMAFVNLFSLSIDPFSESFGYYLLTRPWLYEPMGRFLSYPLTGFLRLDDSLVTGGFVIGILGWPLWFLASLLFLQLYRRFMADKIKVIFQKIGDKVPFLKKLGLAVSASRKARVLL